MRGCGLRQTVLTSLAVFLFGSCTAFCQTYKDQPDNLSKQIGELSNQGQYAEAIAASRRALTLAEGTHGPAHLDTGTALIKLGGLLAAQRHLAEAEPYYARAEVIFEEKARNGGGVDVAVKLNEIANFHFTQRRAARAEQLSKHALAI